MTARAITPAIVIALLGSLCGACERQGDEQADNHLAAQDNAVIASNEADAASNEDIPAQKSIIRPAVTAALEEEQAPPPLEPINAEVRFADRTMKLDEEAKAALDKLIATPAMQAGGPVILRGHSDSRGSDSDNLVASRHRAETVRRYLKDKGIKAERMIVIALGETRPVAPNARLDGSDDPEGRARNRRVEIEIDIPVNTQEPQQEQH